MNDRITNITGELDQEVRLVEGRNDTTFYGRQVNRLALAVAEPAPYTPSRAALMTGCGVELKARDGRPHDAPSQPAGGRRARAGAAVAVAACPGEAALRRGVDRLRPTVRGGAADMDRELLPRVRALVASLESTLTATQSVDAKKVFVDLRDRVRGRDAVGGDPPDQALHGGEPRVVDAAPAHHPHRRHGRGGGVSAPPGPVGDLGGGWGWGAAAGAPGVGGGGPGAARSAGVAPGRCDGRDRRGRGGRVGADR